MSKLKKPELLLPAGSLEKLKVALMYGADAVYLGTPNFSLRSKSQFTLEDVIKGVAFAHENGKRVYLTLNIVSHNKDVDLLPEIIDTLKRIKPDGVIIADPGIFQHVQSEIPDISLHISTQANVCSWLSASFWEKMGAKLIVLGREVSYQELCEIRRKCPNVLLEIFIHGAMCMAHSGRCLLSNYMTERGANQGSCANSCRWKYKVHSSITNDGGDDLTPSIPHHSSFSFFLEEEQRPGEYLPIEEDDRGSYILNGKDLCLLPKLDQYLKIGIDSLKIEGRNRSSYYIATTARAYRKAIDDWFKTPDTWQPKPYMDEIWKMPSRGYTLGFHGGLLQHYAHNYEDTRTLSSWEYAGIVSHLDDEAIFLSVKNRLEYGSILEFLLPDMEYILLRIYEFNDITNQRVTNLEGINAGQKPILRIPFCLFHEQTISELMQKIKPLTIVRKQRLLNQVESARIVLDKTAMASEVGDRTNEEYDSKRIALIEAISKDNNDSYPPAAKSIDTESCCGRGCNGCLRFWHDPKYENARTLFYARKGKSPQGD